RWADQAAAESDDASVTLRVPGDVLEAQTRALREPYDQYTIRSDSLHGKRFEEAPEHTQCGTQGRFILGDGSQEGLRIPRVVRGRRREIRDIRDTPLVGEIQHVFRGAASAVKKDTGHARMSQWRATLHYALPRVRIA